MKSRKRLITITGEDANLFQCRLRGISRLAFYGRMSLLAALGSTIIISTWKPLHGPEARLLHLLALCVGCLLWGKTIQWIWYERLSQQIISIRQVAQQMDITEELLRQVIEEQNLHASVLANGQPYYYKKDFAALLTLLRASSSPEETKETLLRPASSSADTLVRHLLRSSDERQ